MGSGEMDKQAKEKEPKTPPATSAPATTTTTQVYLSNCEFFIGSFRVVLISY